MQQKREREEAKVGEINILAETICLSNILCHEDNFLYTVTKENISQAKVLFFLFLPKKIFPRPRYFSFYFYLRKYFPGQG